MASLSFLARQIALAVSASRNRLYAQTIETRSLACTGDPFF